ncbi:MAG: recombinase RecA [Fusobacteriaceae bacterium]|jgi:recombination protein RecA|nr:recombinase RecA [Fusobacteriaceae bacterium]
MANEDEIKKRENYIRQKEKALDLALNQIKKDFGDGSIMRLGDRPSLDIDTISTGSLLLDYALGNGGVPRGRIIEIYGGESSGKTTIALHIIAEAQKNDGIAAFIDAEHALDPKYARSIGVNIDDLLVSQPDYGEQALEIADMLVRSGSLDVIVIDSVAALVPKVEIDGEMSDQQTALQARLMSKALRKIVGNLSKSNTTLVFINQIREKLNTYNFGPQTTTTGGKALKFYSTIRMEVKKIGGIKNGDQIIGNETLVKVTKNKLWPPFKEATFDIIYGKGISKSSEILALALAAGIIFKNGSFYNYGEILLGQGKENVKEKLENDKDLFELIEEDTIKYINE